LWSANIIFLIYLLQNALKSLGSCEGYEIVIEETHHKRKKDKPSGTALLLQKTIESSTKRKLETPVSIRGGGVFGIHKIQILGEEETLTFEHQALNRTVFARGAISAATWVSQQGPGSYTIQDMLEKNK
jgi:4-hydroxy-tetrahydrodipicolinate reductase